MKPITDEGRARIAQAVAEAEGNTSGEIRCVLVQRTVDHRASAVWIAASWALVIWPAVAYLALLGGVLAKLQGGWQGSQPIAFDLFVVTQLAVFILAWLLASWPALRQALTSKTKLEKRVHAAALAQFEALGLTRTRDRTGILLFVSLADHRAQVLADEGIYAKAPPKVWDEVVGLLVEGLKAGEAASGFISAVGRTGEILAACLPIRPDDVNELPNDLVER